MFGMAKDGPIRVANVPLPTPGAPISAYKKPIIIKSINQSINRRQRTPLWIAYEKDSLLSL
jgi:hypothetical protein